MRKLLEKKIAMEEETMEPSTSNPHKYSRVFKIHVHTSTASSAIT